MTREHIEHLLAALGALAFALFISYFNTGAHAVNVETLSHAQGSLVSVGSSSPFSSPAFGTSTFPDLIVPTSTFEHSAAPATTTTPHPKPQTAPAEPTPHPKPVPTASSTPSAQPASANPLLSTLAPSVVNILCISGTPQLHSISGSGVIIDSRGIILTVAHVAQEVLLQEYLGHGKVICVARVGNPARAAYAVRPIYVSSAWIHANPTTLISSEPTGTGEHDFALLAITASATGGDLPASFPAVALSDAGAGQGDSVGIGSYGAQNLSTAQVENDLVPTLAVSSVKDVYTFDTNTADVLAILGSIAAQEGSSGGGIVNATGRLIGLITTSDISGATSSRELRAITTSYIDRSLDSDAGANIGGYLSGKSLNDLVSAYAPTAQSLGQYLAQAIGLQP